MKAYDFLIQCETGLASITGGPESPGRVGVSVADIGCGMNAHSAILQALFARERTREGCQISVSLFDLIADWMAVPLIHREYTGHEPKRLGLNHATIAPYGAYAAGDGAQFIIAIQTEAEWASLCAVVLARPDMIDDPRFSTNGRRVANRMALDTEMHAALSRFDTDGMTEALRRANVAFGRYNTVGEFAHHVQLRRAEIATPSGPVSVPAPPQVFDHHPTRSACRRRSASTARRSGVNSRARLEAEEIALSQSDLRAWIGRSERGSPGTRFKGTNAG